MSLFNLAINKTKEFNAILSRHGILNEKERQEIIKEFFEKVLK